MSIADVARPLRRIREFVSRFRDLLERIYRAPSCSSTQDRWRPLRSAMVNPSMCESPPRRTNRQYLARSARRIRLRRRTACVDATGSQFNLGSADSRLRAPGCIWHTPRTTLEARLWSPAVPRPACGWTTWRNGIEPTRAHGTTSCFPQTENAVLQQIAAHM